MNTKRITSWTIAACLSFGFASLPAAYAQTTSDQAAPAANPAPATSKAAQKAQRKADRKANRAKKNAELSQLEKNGYSPGGDQINYPQNLQNAQAKVNAQNAAKAKAASAP